jgi:arylsulfatase
VNEPDDNRGIFDKAGTGTLIVEGKELEKWDESFNVGVDTRTPIDDRDYQVPFRFTGKIDKITLTIDRPKLSPADIKLLEQEAQRNNHASE